MRMMQCMQVIADFSSSLTA